MSTQKIVGVLGLLALINLNTQTAKANTVVGAAVGAAVGSAIGQQSNGRDGALVGGALGGLIGASVGNDLEGRRGGSDNRPDYGRNDDRDDGDYRRHHDYRRPRYAPPQHHHHHYYGYHPSYRKYKHWKRPVIIRESRGNHFNFHYAYR